MTEGGWYDQNTPYRHFVTSIKYKLPQYDDSLIDMITSLFTGNVLLLLLLPITKFNSVNCLLVQTFHFIRLQLLFSYSISVSVHWNLYDLIFPIRI